MKFLLDANLSPETALYLRSFCYDAKSLIEEKKGHLSDHEVIARAVRERRIIVTFDLDFGELYYFSYKKRIGVVILRLRDQRVEMVHAVLTDFLANLHRSIDKRLVILTESDIRIS
jgi:predicted nuclease of predicted toxin-antitoxin system